MFKQVVLPLLGVVIFIVIVGIFSQKSSLFSLSGNPSAQPSATPLGQKLISVAGKEVNVEVANTESDRARGLGGRTSLGANAGMLFIFDAKDVTPSFWMKDMLIPIDIIWIHSSSGDVSDGKIVRIDKNVPAPTQGTPDNKLKVYRAGRSIDYVLEVNAGYSDSNNVKVGNSIDLSGI